MGLALYRKYRSQNMSEVLGQEHITTALQHAIDSNRLSHAYLFTGPRGTGKTSIARILANAINDLPYSTNAHLDIIEIDAASNRRIDEIRDLRDKVYIAPTSAKYKVYIIDEVHMLTREAFNALLKTLEEPPEHVVFILATTDAHKLPETIISRTQRYNFRPVDAAQVVAHLKHIAKQEKIKIDDDALQLLAEHGEGSFRDSISLLDQVSNQQGVVSIEAVRQQLGIPSVEGVDMVLQSLTGSNLSAPVIAVQVLYDQGYRAAAIAEQIGGRLRQQLTDNNTAISAPSALALLRSLLDVSSSPNPERHLELILMQAMTPGAAMQAPMSSPVVAASKISAPTVSPKPSAAKKTTAAKSAPTPQPAPQPINLHHQKPIDEATWALILAELKKQYNTIYGIVRMAHTDFTEPGRVHLTFAFAFHQKRMTDPKNRTIIADTIAHVTGQQVELICTVSKNPQPRPAGAAVAGPIIPPEGALQDINDIFGGGEIL